MGASGAEEHGWAVTTIAAERDGSVVLRVTSTREAVACPDCGTPSRRRHSWYTRRALDLPWRGAIVRLRIRSRRWFCDEPVWRRKIFAERFDGLLARCARRTNGATDLLVEFGLRAGGEGGARLARKVGVPTSPDTLLRLVKLLGTTIVATPRVLGIDDFSLRRGVRYATVLIDLERHKPIDVLPTRDADPVIEWLQAHPGVEVLVRDRGGAYAEAGRRGAPNAVQVADAFTCFRTSAPHWTRSSVAEAVARRSSGCRAKQQSRASFRRLHRSRSARFSSVPELHESGVLHVGK